ncbi:hypothetical protein HYY69_05870 [Candidatus Woesearchaeota archaeon]|nr:hypothetical protein [Candidatus Woesearchaeota archaeon]
MNKSKLKRDVILYSIIIILIISLVYLGKYVQHDSADVAGKVYRYADFGAAPADGKEKYSVRTSREKRSSEILPEEEFNLKQCLSLGCYDTDGDNPDVSGAVYLRKQKLGGKQYCVSSDDGCKKYEDKWYVIEQTCKDQCKDEEGNIQSFCNDQNIQNYFVTQAIPKPCEGVCNNGACQQPSCEDGIQNQDEEQVDCGGVCDVCVSESCDDPFGFTPLVKDHVIVKDIKVNDVNDDGLQIYDSCVDEQGKSVDESTILFERTCKDNSLNKEQVHCKCKNGACEKAWCMDSDEKDIHNQGFTSGIQSGNMYAGPLTVKDTCNDGKDTPESELGSHVVELFCNPEDYLSYGDFIKCPDGEWCFDGACQKVICQDTDGGSDSFKKGSTKGFSKDWNYLLEGEDKCLTGKEILETSPELVSEEISPEKIYVLEHYCNKEEKFIGAYIECKNGCTNGACNEEMICTDSDGGKDIHTRGEVEVNPKNGPKIYGADHDYCDNKNNPGFYLLNTGVEERSCKTLNTDDTEMIDCNSNEICDNGKCQLKTELFCYSKDEKGNMNKVYYLEGDTCNNSYNCNGDSFIISKGTYTDLYKAFINSVNGYAKTLQITFNDNKKPAAKGLDIKKFSFDDAKETTFEYQGIKFTLVIDTKKKSIFFKDLGTYPKELQNIQCPLTFVPITPILMKNFPNATLATLCTDPDNTKSQDPYILDNSIFVKTTGYIKGQKEPNDYYTDTCGYSTNYGNRNDYSTIFEFTCSSKKVIIEPTDRFILFKCPSNYICQDGACIKK